MTTTNDLIAAAADADLRARVQAAAEAHGLGSGWADSQMGRLVAIAIPAGGLTATIADVYGYAVSTYKPTPRPGQNPAAVTDEMIFEAIDVVSGVGA